jgi:hypothetical protein
MISARQHGRGKVAEAAERLEVLAPKFPSFLIGVELATEAQGRPESQEIRKNVEESVLSPAIPTHLNVPRSVERR